MRTDSKASLDIQIKLDCQDCKNEEEIARKLFDFASQPPGREEIAFQLIIDPVTLQKIDKKRLMKLAGNEGFAWVEVETAESQALGIIKDKAGDCNTVMLCRNLRSGQKFYSPENVVILGDVNPGAEVIAGGNIIVIGALRGMAHAGKFGDVSAVIGAYRLCPTQLRISDHITRPPDGESMEVHTPEIARIREGEVVIEPMKI